MKLLCKKCKPYSAHTASIEYDILNNESLVAHIDKCEKHGIIKSV